LKLNHRSTNCLFFFIYCWTDTGPGRAQALLRGHKLEGGPILGQTNRLVRAAVLSSTPSIYLSTGLRALLLLYPPPYCSRAVPWRLHAGVCEPLGRCGCGPTAVGCGNWPSSVRRWTPTADLLKPGRRLPAPGSWLSWAPGNMWYARGGVAPEDAGGCRGTRGNAGGCRGMLGTMADDHHSGLTLILIYIYIYI